MYPINIGVKTGYMVKDPSVPVNIRDSKGILFYTTEPFLENGKHVMKFNLPAGKYFCDSGYITPMILPVTHKRIPLPAYQRVFVDPENFNIIFGDNPAKCSILWGKKTIIFDKSFADKPLPEVEFILGHEFGHRFYGGFDAATQQQQYQQAEKYCDWFSANRMLDLGYNPSQIGSGNIDSLSDRAIERKFAIVDKLKAK